MKYKLIAIAGDDAVTGEFENMVNSLKDAEIRAEELRQEWFNDGYPDAYVACFDYNEDVRYPYADYRCWVQDCFGDTYWKWMKVSEMGSRLYMYLK